MSYMMTDHCQLDTSDDWGGLRSGISCIKLTCRHVCSTLSLLLADGAGPVYCQNWNSWAGGSEMKKEDS